MGQKGSMSIKTVWCSLSSHSACQKHRTGTAGARIV